MSFGGFDKKPDAPIADINMIPLIDVMLVLLVIFIITAPVLTHSIPVNLPAASSQLNRETPDTCTLSIDASGNLFWNEVATSETEVSQHIAHLLKTAPESIIHLRADRMTPYEPIARTLALAQQEGAVRIALVTEPRER